MAEQPDNERRRGHMNPLIDPLLIQKVHHQGLEEGYNKGWKEGWGAAWKPAYRAGWGAGYEEGRRAAFRIVILGAGGPVADDALLRLSQLPAEKLLQLVREVMRGKMVSLQFPASDPHHLD